MADVVFENVTKRFGKVAAVDNLTLEIEDGAFIVLLGPTGPATPARSGCASL